jgi:DNA polymerase III delta prime subunit
MIYTGDRLDLYNTLREICEQPGSSVTPQDLPNIQQVSLYDMLQAKMGPFLFETS